MIKIHAPLFPLTCCLIAGITWGGCLDNWTIPLLVLVVAIPIISLISRWPRYQTAGIWCCMLLLGIVLGIREQHHPHTRPSVSTKAAKVRQQLQEHYRQWGISDEAIGVVTAMTLGEKSQLDSRVKETFSKTGAAHILALSGLHLMIIYSFISLFFSRRRFRLLSQIVIITALWAFAFLVGMSPSIVRSAFMISIYSLLSLGHRERMSINTLSLTAIVMLIVNPQSLYDIGFQLSFMAVLTILLFNPLFGRLIPLHLLQRHHWLKGLWGLTIVSISAQIGTAPLVAYYFGRFSILFLLSNFIVMPMATAVLYLAISCLLTCWWGWLQHLLATVLSTVVVWTNGLLLGISQLPYCSIEGISLSPLQVALIFVVVGCVYILFSLTVPKARQSV
ncbi:MAG: ComEC/Rec2 family competence protein [Prevotella sp.]|nr:ComEC/Rec2 family competence protein [Prevotella sp.]